MSTPPDPRRGRPSCSALKRLANCPASYRLSQGLPDTESEDAASGTRIHEWLATGSKDSWDALTGDEQDTAERCLSQTHEVLARWLTDIGATDSDIIVTVCEQRLGLTPLGFVFDVRDGDGRIYSITGQPDDVTVVEVGGKRYGLTIDFKSGRGEVEHAVGNDQLRGLAVLVSTRYACSSVRVAIVQPWAGPPTEADYDAAALGQAREWLECVVDNLGASELGPVAGDWCQYCRAATLPCPALVEAGTRPVASVLLATPLPSDTEKHKDALFARAMECDAETLAGLLERRTIVSKAMFAIEAAARRRIADGEEIPGWKLHATKPKESITAVGVVWEHLSALGCQPGEFTAACGMTKKALEPLVRKLTGTKGAALRTAIAGALAGAVTLGKPSVRLVAAGETGELEDAE